MLPLKVNAIVSSERSKPCLHTCFSWTGRMPGTGLVRCPMCGTSWIDLEAAGMARVS